MGPGLPSSRGQVDEASIAAGGSSQAVPDGSRKSSRIRAKRDKQKVWIINILLSVHVPWGEPTWPI